MWPIYPTFSLLLYVTEGKAFLFFSNQPRLETYNVDKNAVSVSGISSGAAMAIQYHVAHSADVMGAGVMAGVPYGCAGLAGMTAALCMLSPSAVVTSALVTMARAASDLGTVDDIQHLRNDRVFVYQSPTDAIVNHVAGQKVVEFYSHFISNPSDIATKFDLSSAHGVPTLNYGSACGTSGTEYLLKCGYSAAFHILNHIYGGSLQEPTSSTVQAGKLFKFDQSAFFYLSTPGVYSMDTVGYVYVPSGCQDKSVKCKLHIAFHGCQQGRKYVDEAFVRHAGYNEVGELNNIIILYPQATSGLGNPVGCWDWWGYTGGFYGTKEGFQMTAVSRMVNRVTG